MPRNLRYRVAVFFASFGAIISLALASALYFAAKDLRQRLVDETLTAELDDYIARRERNPNSLPPSTVTLHGYVQDATSQEGLPSYLRSLLPGRHDLQVGDSSYRVAVVDVHASRFFLLYDVSAQRRREWQLALLLGVLVVAVTMLSGLGGIALAAAVTAPVAELATQVRTRGPDDWAQPLAEGFAHDDVGELARVFDRHTARMRAFIERERALTADMSHELRTSLAVILSAAEMLLSDESLTERQKKRVVRIDRAARDMAELGTALLLMAHEESSFAGGGACVVASVVEEAVEKHRHLLRKKPVRVDVHTDPGLEVQADRGLVDILVSNLIRNAYSYTDSGIITVQQDGRDLIISDTGRGIPGDALNQVFLRNFKDAASEGAGIGLSLVKRICDRYGWRIRLESRENEGTTVTIRFQ
ncbi:MAG: HAMP domain-containing histidine kinase [Betaproteobacteria bacterium]|nr:HAMP domain-containing histidine kinase [Betaproteobacteria bacterium]